MVGEAAEEAVFQIGEGAVGYGVQMRLRLVEKSGENFRACEVQQHAFAFVLVALPARPRPRNG